MYTNPRPTISVDTHTSTYVKPRFNVTFRRKGKLFSPSPLPKILDYYANRLSPLFFAVHALTKIHTAVIQSEVKSRVQVGVRHQKHSPPFDSLLLFSEMDKREMGMFTILFANFSSHLLTEYSFRSLGVTLCLHVVQINLALFIHGPATIMQTLVITSLIEVVFVTTGVPVIMPLGVTR